MPNGSNIEKDKRCLVPKHPHKMQTLFFYTCNVFQNLYFFPTRRSSDLLGISQLWHRTVEEIEKKGRARKKVAFAEGLRPRSEAHTNTNESQSDTVGGLLKKNTKASPLVAITDLCLMDPTSRRTNVALSPSILTRCRHFFFIPAMFFKIYTFSLHDALPIY